MCKFECIKNQKPKQKQKQRHCKEMNTYMKETLLYRTQEIIINKDISRFRVLSWRRAKRSKSFYSGVSTVFLLTRFRRGRRICRLDDPPLLDFDRRLNVLYLLCCPLGQSTLDRDRDRELRNPRLGLSPRGKFRFRKHDWASQAPWGLTYSLFSAAPKGEFPWADLGGCWPFRLAILLATSIVNGIGL